MASISRSDPYVNDNRDFGPLLDKTAAVAGLKRVVADRGYDSEKNHLLCASIGAIAVIPARNADVPVWRTHGVHRKDAKRSFDWKSYRRRSLIETVNSVEKRLQGSYVSSRKGWTQKKELCLVDIVYDIHRYIVLKDAVFYLWLRISTEPLPLKSLYTETTQLIAW